MKKQFAIIALGLIMGATMLESCKKGENDPGISFRSRKGRMAGDWKVTNWTGTSVDGSSSTTTTFTYDGTTYTETTAPNPAQSYPRTMEFTFEKDGTFKSMDSYTIASTVYKIDVTGTWNFTGKIGEDKNKDHIVMKTLTQTFTIGTNPPSSSTYTGDNAPTSIMYVDQLKNKEIIFKYKGTTTSGTPATTDSDEGEMMLMPK